jgi:hypothetical protein
MASAPLAAASASPMPEGITDPNYKPLPGRLGNLTIIQQHALEKLKKELIEEGAFVEDRMDDALLLRYVAIPPCLCLVSINPASRFLRARQFDVVKAKAMLLDCEKWRKEFGVDDVVK